MSEVKGKKFTISKPLKYLAIVLWLLFVLIPVYTAFVGSVTPSTEIGSSFLYPKQFHWQNYLKLFTDYPFADYFRTSLIYSFSASFLSVIVAAPSAYAIARFRFSGKKLFMITMLIVQSIPQIIIVVIMFKFLSGLNLHDTYIAVILTMTATSLSFPVLLLNGFFRDLPISLEEAGMIDGCSRLGVLWRIVIPLSAPGVMTAFALSFFMNWAEFLIPLILTNSPDKIPLTVGISNLLDVVPPWELIMAGTLISTVPAVIVYLSIQKFLTGGAVAGGVKG